MMWNGYDGRNWWGMGSAHGVVFWIFVIAGVVALAVWIANPARRRDTDSRRSQTALDVLKMRYARGEIGREEFEEKKRDLQA